ncbi:MAG TPA: hypothetical protein VF743_01565 [Acidimicrobiales bacterium]
MSPVARSRAHAGRALAVAAAGVVVALGTAFAVSVLASRGSVEVRLGDETFEAGSAERAAGRIADSGPVLYPDAAGGDRDIYLQHLGDDPETGWLAFAARPAQAPRECTLQWEPAGSGDPADGSFRLLDADGEESGACDGERFPATGEGLPSYPVEVADGRLTVDLNAADRATTTTAG